MDKILYKIECWLWLGLITCIVTLVVCHLVIKILPESELEEVEIEFPEVEEEEAEVKVWKENVTVTVYNPLPGQCDSDPLITADNSKIDLRKLKNNQLKWVAVSRDLLGKNNLQYGDKIQIICEEDPSLNEIYYIHDTMNKRYRKSVDILFHQENRTWGKYRNVQIIKL